MTYEYKRTKGIELDAIVSSTTPSYLKGTALKQISRDHNVSYHALWQRFKKKGILRRKGNRDADLSGFQFGNLTVVRKAPPNKYGWTMWECVCKCGKTTVHSTTNVKRTKSCGCGKFTTGVGNKKWCGHGEISLSFFSRIKHGASDRDLACEIQIEEIWQLFLRQDRKCALSGIPLVFGKSIFEHGTASLDRIDSSHGYVAGNVQWVHKEVNRMKGALSDQEFIQFCKGIVNHNENRIF